MRWRQLPAPLPFALPTWRNEHYNSHTVVPTAPIQLIDSIRTIGDGIIDEGWGRTMWCVVPWDRSIRPFSNENVHRKRIGCMFMCNDDVYVSTICTYIIRYKNILCCILSLIYIIYSICTRIEHRLIRISMVQTVIQSVAITVVRLPSSHSTILNKV